MTDNFYKYIQKRGDSYSINRWNGTKVERYGTYNKLTDALYERDRLIQANWDWDDLMSMEETDNIYETMELPKFTNDTMYIQYSPPKYKVYLNREYKGTFKDKNDAEEYADEIGGRIVNVHTKYKIQKCIDGVTKYFGQYSTLNEAKKIRDELIQNGWKK